MPIKTYRGLLADGGQDQVSLHTNNGLIGYRIKKFNGISNLPGTADAESTLMIWKVEQDTVSTTVATVDFSDQTLLAVLYYVDEASDTTGPVDSIIFDNEIFNQDIFVTHTATSGAVGMNYYIELEQIKLDLAESTTATLKDIRNTAE